MMVNSTNKNLDFLSNEELINVLRSILDEIDVVASSGAYRSTTYLTVSAIEGLFGELLKLLRLEPVGNFVPKKWPFVDKKTKQLKTPDKLTLEEREIVLQANGALPPDFESLYAPVRVFRNYMHPARELKNQTPIDQSVSQLALACLNALIEKYSPLRFVAMQQWRLGYGIAQVPTDNLIQMPPKAGDYVSLLVSEKSASSFREIRFNVTIPPGNIFNFLYNYFSKDRFKGARIDRREGGIGGRIECVAWRDWSFSDAYDKGSELNSQQRQYAIQVILDPPGTFMLIVDGKERLLEGRVDWNFDPKGKIGFLTELGMVSIVDLEIVSR